MFGKLSRKRKAELRLRAQEARKKKLRSRDEIRDSESFDETELLAPLDSVGEENSSSKDNGTAQQADHKSIYREWIAEMSRLDQQRLAMMLFDNYRDNFGLMKTDTACQVASFFGISDRTVRTWRKSFLQDPENYGVEHRGKYPRCVLTRVDNKIYSCC